MMLLCCSFVPAPVHASCTWTYVRFVHRHTPIVAQMCSNAVCVLSHPAHTCSCCSCWCSTDSFGFCACCCWCPCAGCRGRFCVSNVPSLSLSPPSIPAFNHPGTPPLLSCTLPSASSSSEMRLIVTMSPFPPSFAVLGFRVVFFVESVSFFTS